MQRKNRIELFIDYVGIKKVRVAEVLGMSRPTFDKETVKDSNEFYDNVKAAVSLILSSVIEGKPIPKGGNIKNLTKEFKIKGDLSLDPVNDEGTKKIMSLQAELIKEKDERLKEKDEIILNLRKELEQLRTKAS